MRMNRRSLLAALGVAPIAAVSALKLAPAQEELQPVASSMFRMSSGYAPERGWRSGLAIEARVSEYETFRGAGMFIDVTECPSRVVFDVDQSVVSA